MVNCIVIDDSQNIVDVFCDLLKISGIDVIATGNNGMQAVKLYEKYIPDIAFIDLQMPEYDGFYAIENIKDKKYTAKIIAITGDPHAKNSALLNSLNIPVVDKPFDMNVIKQSMTNVFLTGDDSATVLEIQYKFKEDYNTYSCLVTYEQYRNFKKIPLMENCEIINDIQKNIELTYKEMQNALDLAFKNNITHIRNLSEVVK